MHISRLSLRNYRNFRGATFVFKKGINTIIGENGSGKSNVFRAIRLLLDDNMRRSAIRLEEEDFSRALSNWRGHWIIISMEFEEISADESIQSLFLHGAGNVEAKKIEKATYNLIFRPKAEIRIKLSKLANGDKAGLSAIRDAIQIEDYETVFTGKSAADFTDPATYREIVGDFKNVVFNSETELPEVGVRVAGLFSISQDVCFTYIQALRDVVAEFRNNKTNPLLTLLHSKSGQIDPAKFAPLTKIVKDLNGKIENLAEVQTLRTDIRDVIKETAGETYSPSKLSIKSDLSDEAEKMFQSLKLFVGESNDDYEGGINELSLGGANLIYLTLKLLEFKYQRAKQSFANFLLIEEPEAHIHTHIQKTLFDKLRYENTQIIYTTHSTQISEVSNVESMNIIGRQDKKSEVYQPTNGLTPSRIGSIQRYLDAVRSNLLFARSVLLVEGDAEELLIPVMVKKALGLSLDELGISLVNVRSTGFENVAVMFHDDRINKRCAILTDHDASIIDVTPDATDSVEEAQFKLDCKASAEAGERRKIALEKFATGNEWIETCFAKHTFEVDFVGAGNSWEVCQIVEKVYKSDKTKALAETELNSDEVENFGRRVLTMANQQGKGWFAIMLGEKVTFRTVIPPYILDAIAFAVAEFTDQIWEHIINYRLTLLTEGGVYKQEAFKEFNSAFDSYKLGLIEMKELRDQYESAFPDEDLNQLFERL